MKGDVLAIGVATEGKKAIRSKALWLQPLLGKNCLELALVNLRSLKPAKIYLATNLPKEDLLRDEAFSTNEIIAAQGWPQDLSFVFSLRDELARMGEGDLLILDARFPLLQLRTLRSFFRHHLKEKNTLTLLITGQKVPFSSVAALLIRRERIGDILVHSAKRKRSRLLLTGLISRFERKEEKIEALTLSPDEAVVIDCPARVALAMRILRLRKIRELEARGVMVLDPLSTWVDLDVRVGRDTVLYPAVVIEGNSRLGRECRVYPFVHLIHTQVGNRVRVLSSTMIESSRIEDDAQVGPFTHFRPRTVLRSRAKVGNFVEMKNTIFGPGSKAGHLSYLGDCVVESGVNVGAGTITCNYDGLRKHRTIIEKGAFIGSGTELVAPVRVGRNAYIGAGSTITKDVSPEALAVARSRQVEKLGWVRRKMKK